ncbi:sigma 54-interacting transcriptional regulator [Clostridium sp. SYSU_GA19001]|uniref:sigma-54 interaction domain-containing protein n=1 Tax=Clostridium caldaquaticum TaxID=2940653 RepID=UPI00207733C7|nr:sigma 54-interacting transcriptional regulator [Clostridium caldaquaticum]MCM8711236.1 sigma 54-interacting transcriptional regulator [Clostridium caldaquaticum]
MNRYEIEKNKKDKKDFAKIIEKYHAYKSNKMNLLSVADEVSDSIYVVDKNGVFIDANKNFEKIVGMKKKELIGMNMNEVWDKIIYTSEEAFIEINPENKMPIMALISGNMKKGLKGKKPKPVGLIALEEKRKVSVITRILRRNMTVIMTGIPFFDENKEIEWVITVIRDISQFMQLEEKLEIFENSKEAYINELKYLRKSQMETELIGESREIEEIKRYIQKVSKTDVTVLITGETGAGKEVVAREIYKNSLRKDGPYIKINCAAIPEMLLESELFGYEKGAFTGAQHKEKLGLFEVANGGTILLDEIGEMPIMLQAKLLRVLQDKEFLRVGGTTPVKVDVRVIAATNQNLFEQIKKGLFRQDLYFRLNVFPINLLPLRQRKEDIKVLAYYFLNKSNKKYNRNKKFEKNAVVELESYNWPGNVRELQNIIDRLVLINEEEVITENHVISVLGKNTELYGVSGNNLNLKESVNMLEKNIIEKALKKYGSTYKAAEVLGIKQSTVVKKAKVLGIKNWR